MSQIVCISDNFSDNNPFIWSCGYLAANFDTQVVTIDSLRNLDIRQWAINTQAKVFVTNVPQALVLMPLPIIFYVTNYFSTDPSIKRQLALRAGKLDVFAANKDLAIFLYKTCQIQARIQYPYVEPKTGGEGIGVVCTAGESFITSLQNETEETLWAYEAIEDLAIAKVYIHVGAEHWDRILLAGSFGVPTICDNDEFSPQVILPRGANLKQWIQGLKTTMRDRDILAQTAKQGNRKYNNLDALVDRVRRETIARELQSAPPAARNLLQERMSQRTEQVLAKRAKPTTPIQQTDQFIGFKREDYKAPTASVLSTPHWFDAPPAFVSVIVPMFNSRAAIDEQIRNWDLINDRIATEVIYVNDACPQNSPEQVLFSWQDIKNERDTSRSAYPNGFDAKIGKIVTLGHNSGFATACNVGATQATGKYLIFLNADTVVTPGWIKPMVDLMESDPTIGIVGNLQLKQDGSIDSAGSQWMRDSKSFDHIGRNVYKGKRLRKSMNLSNAPEDLYEVGERDMVTGCCLMIRKSLFDEIKFDVNYRIGYWEDSDLNMEVKTRGYKIYYQPRSIIYHTPGHSGAANHPYVYDNAKYFYEKWVNNGRIDSLCASV